MIYGLAKVHEARVLGVLCALTDDAVVWACAGDNSYKLNKYDV